MGAELVIKQTPLNGLYVIQMPRHTDDRGSFSRLFCQSNLQALLGGCSIRQINHSVNLTKGVTRGLHFMQLQAGEYKLVRCLRGSVFDVVVDARPESSSYKQHFSIELSEQNDLMLLIPPGCAHGFQALADNSQLLYMHTADYQAEYDMGYRVDDPGLQIKWPLPVQQLSARDMKLPFIDNDHVENAL